jgi:creatinine amidohydrolase
MSMSQFEELKPYVDTLVLPIGTVEAHGPHAPLGTDVLIPKALADRIEGKLSGRIWTAPEVAYGHCFSFRDFPGTIDVPPRIFADYVHAIVSSFARWGIQHVVLLNGHGGNIHALNEVADRLTAEGLYVLVSNYWVDYRDRIAEIAPGVGHGGEDETSLVMAIQEGWVNLERAGDHQASSETRAKFPEMAKRLYPDAYFGNAKAATADKGDRLFDLITDLVVQDIMSMWRHNS